MSKLGNCSGGTDPERYGGSRLAVRYEPIVALRLDPQNPRLDAFLGSGTTLIAAERTGRRCCGIELDLLYVDTIIRRWQAYAGEIARHAVSGQSFAALAKERGGQG